MDRIVPQVQRTMHSDILSKIPTERSYDWLLQPTSTSKISHIRKERKKDAAKAKKPLFLGQQHDSYLKLRMFLFIGVLIHIPLNNYHGFFLYIARQK